LGAQPSVRFSWRKKTFLQLNYKSISLSEGVGTLPKKSRGFSRNAIHVLIKNMIKAKKVKDCAEKRHKKC